MKDLTAREVATLTRLGKHRVSRNLYLQVQTNTTGQDVTRAWLFRYMRDGKNRYMGLGPFDLVSLADAREKARAARSLLLEGIDPIEARRFERTRARLEASRSLTFKDCAEKYITAHEPSWRNEKHRAQWRSTIETYVYPVLGDLPVAAVDTALVLKALEPIWTTKPETAGRVRGRMEAVLDWATARTYRTGENPARWKGHLDKLLPPRRRVARVRHHAALPWREVSGFMQELRRQEGVSPRALEFAILTAARTGEVIGAMWSEIDVHEKVWTVPAERMKGGREHRVPLPDRVLAILEELPRENGSEHVFIGSRAGRPLSNMAMLKVLQRMGRGDLTVHGFRSTFRDWAAETTSYPREVAEMALAHAVSDQVEAAYRRGDLFAKRRRLVEGWARYCASLPRAKGEVVALRG